MRRRWHRGGRRTTATAPVPGRRPGRRVAPGHPTAGTAALVGEAASWTLLLGALALGVACVLLPKVLGAVPLTILSGSMAPAMPAGALAVVRPVDATQARVGDVLTYQPGSDDPMLVTHRVTAITRNGRGEVSLTLKGDANNAPDERPVHPDQVRGSVVYSVPYVGWATNRLSTSAPVDLVDGAAHALIAVGVLRLLLALVGARPSRRRGRGDHGRPVTGDRS